MAEEEVKVPAGRRKSVAELPADERPEESGYVAKKVGLDEILAKDQEDESLQKYKQNLLGQAAQVKARFPEDPRHVIVESCTMIFPDHPPIVINPTDPNLRSRPFTLKEGTTYTTKVRFYIQHDIVSGLKHLNLMYKHGIRVEKFEETLGSFAPQLEPYEVTLPEDTVPDGFMARGSYTAKTRFIDDDKNIHLEFEYGFEIARNWE
eukprot:TRINITY_DN150_c0_g1_i2.p2 TRINITY_DN150_c0_g1~~TRINITY_DN150_c0_g1_i2.p2  ORF type:complete len:206 (-),score=89.31 TRINITY_DN150_c0_g1_i2:109-726(-)